MVSLSPSWEAKRNYYNYLKTELLPRHLAQPTRRAFTMKPHHRSPGTTPHNTVYSFFISADQRTKSGTRLSLKTSASLFASKDALLFYQVSFTRLLKNSSNIASSKNLPKHPWTEFVIRFIFIAYHTMPKFIHFKITRHFMCITSYFTHSTLRIHKQPEYHACLYAPNTCAVSDTEV